MTAARDRAERAAAVVAAARGWLGTPYRHGASVRGAGADCLGLIRGIWRSLYGTEPEVAAPYTPDWDESAREERLWRAAGRHCAEIALADAGPGDLLLFRMRSGAPAKHLAVLAADTRGAATMIHAYSGRGVVESPLGLAWRRRLAAAFRFPQGVL
jgi:NlpC/P60 family putative phage cell wall peptidase